MQYDLEYLPCLSKLVEDTHHILPFIIDEVDSDKMVYHIVCSSKVVYDNDNHKVTCLRESDMNIDTMLMRFVSPIFISNIVDIYEG